MHVQADGLERQPLVVELDLIGQILPAWLGHQYQAPPA
jgi:hypothetical protein